MGYEGEFAGYRALKRLVETERVKLLLRRTKVITGDTSVDVPLPMPQPSKGCSPEELPSFVIAIDGSHHEVDVDTGYPGAKVGYLTVASVLIKLAMVEELDAQRPVDPAAFRQTETPATIDAALPGSNVVTRVSRSAKTSFREELYEVFCDVTIDSASNSLLIDTYEALLKLKPASKPPRCPYSELGCEENFSIMRGTQTCPCAHKRSVWSTDALRIHERFHDTGTNGEAFGEVMQVWERVLLVHLLRVLEQNQLLGKASQLAFFVDGPLALFGHPAWLSTAIGKELRRINAKVKATTGEDLLIVGVEKTGAFVAHFDEVDRTDRPGDSRFPNGTFFMPSDIYIKRRIIYSESPKRYGKDTYFGRKFFYKTASGARVVASIPFLNDDQDTLEDIGVEAYSCFPRVCQLLDKLVSCRYPNALSPIVSAHAQAAIPLSLGGKVLEQLTQALLNDGEG